jgi:hypothetical protein
MKATINAKGTEITVLSKGDENDFISLTDIARYKNPEFPADVVKNWMRTRNTIEFLGLWEQLNNPDFKLVKFDQFGNEAGSNAFVLSNLESMNAELIKQEIPQNMRLVALNKMAIEQMTSILGSAAIKQLEGKNRG